MSTADRSQRMVAWDLFTAAELPFEEGRMPDRTGLGAPERDEELEAV